MPKQSAKRPEVEAQDDNLFDELGESDVEETGSEPPDAVLSVLREVQTPADGLRLPVDTLQRIQVASILLLVRELRSLREALVGTKGAAAPGGGFDSRYFRDLIKRELGTEIEDQTLQRAFRLAGDPARLERAVASVKKTMGTADIGNPVGLLVWKLQDWRERDRKRR